MLYYRAKKRQEEPLKFFVYPSIPRENIEHCVDIKGDGFCGYRTIAYHTEGSQDAFMEVKKKMLNCFRINKSVYEKHYRYMRESLPIIEEALAYGAENSIPRTFCPVEYWFTIPHFAQVAADTYKRPVAVYTDNITKKPNSDDFVLEPLMYVPFQGPLLTNKEPVLIIMQLVNNNHWATIKPKGRIIRID